MILIDLLMTIMITLMLIPIVIVSLSVLMSTLHFEENVQDMIASYQLRRILLLAYDKEISDQTLSFTCQNAEMRLSQVNENIIIQPGTQIIYANVENTEIYQVGNVIYLAYERYGKKYAEAIANAQ